MGLLARIDEVIARLRSAPYKEREAVKDELLAICREQASPEVREHLEAARKDLPLELRWEIDEVLEAIAPKPAPKPEEPKQEEERPSDGRLRMSDLKEVYADPRGLALYTDKSGKRWFASQIDPYTGQPVMMEVPADQIETLKAQLRGSPYWRIGSGVIS